MLLMAQRNLPVALVKEARWSGDLLGKLLHGSMQMLEARWARRDATIRSSNLMELE